MTGGRTLRYSEMQPQTTATPTTSIQRPPCFGKRYDVNDLECRHQCSHRSACAPVFRATAGTGGHVPARPGVSAAGAVTQMANAVEHLPEHTEMDGEEGENFFSKLAYNTSLQALEAVVHELHYAVRSIPRKRYFDEVVK